MKVTLSRLEVFSRDAAKNKATCNLCKRVYSYKGYSTTALKRHLDTKQQFEVKQQQPQMPAVIFEPAEKIELREKFKKSLFATSMKLVSSLDSLLVSGTDRSFVIDTLVSTLIKMELKGGSRLTVRLLLPLNREIEVLNMRLRLITRVVL